MTFASRDTEISSVDLHAHVNSYGQWAETLIANGFSAYITSYMFKLGMISKLANEENKRCSAIMEEEIKRVFTRFLTECVRNPRSEKNQGNLPILFGCQDWPVPKNNKADRFLVLPHEGAHWGSILFIPPRVRLKTGVPYHFEYHRRAAYIRPERPLSRIHVEPITYRPSQAVGYTLKSVLRRKIGVDDLLVLPRARSELD